MYSIKISSSTRRRSTRNSMVTGNLRNPSIGWHSSNLWRRKSRRRKRKVGIWSSKGFSCSARNGWESSAMLSISWRSMRWPCMSEEWELLLFQSTISGIRSSQSIRSTKGKSMGIRVLKQIQIRKLFIWMHRIPRSSYFRFVSRRLDSERKSEKVSFRIRLEVWFNRQNNLKLKWFMFLYVATSTF